jgi:hypothetical protein
MASKNPDLEQLEMEDKPVHLQTEEVSDSHLKRSKKRIILRPKPSDDPNDPLVSNSPSLISMMFYKFPELEHHKKNTQPT